LPRHTTYGNTPQSEKGRKVHVRTDTSRRANTIITEQTSVSTTAVRIVTPSDAKNFLLKHEDPNVTIWIGNAATIAIGDSDIWPLNYGDTLVLDQYQLDDENSIYAIADSGTVTVYCAGTYLES